MKQQILICSIALGFLTSFQTATSAEATTKVKCTEVIAKLESEIAKEPARVLLAVEDALNANDTCACDIIKSAIATSKADPKLVGEIVSTGINACPTAASTIGECALAASPEAAKEIKQAMQNALGQGDGAGSGKEPISAGKEPIMGKEPIDKRPVVAKPMEPDYAAPAVDIQGIYFSVPGGGGTTTKTEIVTKVIKPNPKKKKPHTGSTSSTNS